MVCALGKHHSALLSVTATKGNDGEEERYGVDTLMGNTFWGLCSQ